MADLVRKQHDTWPMIEGQLKGNDIAVNLTTATSVKLLLKSQGSGSIEGGGTCTITDAAAGRVAYDLVGADTEDVTIFNGEFEVTWADGSIQTFPNSGYFTLEITPDLG